MTIWLGSRSFSSCSTGGLRSKDLTFYRCFQKNFISWWTRALECRARTSEEVNPQPTRQRWDRSSICWRRQMHLNCISLKVSHPSSTSSCFGIRWNLLRTNAASNKTSTSTALKTSAVSKQPSTTSRSLSTWSVASMTSTLPNNPTGMSWLNCWSTWWSRLKAVKKN